MALRLGYRAAGHATPLLLRLTGRLEHSMASGKTRVAAGGHGAAEEQVRRERQEVQRLQLVTRTHSSARSCSSDSSLLSLAMASLRVRSASSCRARALSCALRSRARSCAAARCFEAFSAAALRAIGSMRLSIASGTSVLTDSSPAKRTFKHL